MNYPSYQETKKTELAWVPVVPTHWNIKRLQFLATCNDDVLTEDTNPLQEIEYVDISNVNLTDGIVAIDKFIFDVAPSRARRRVQDGDTIVSTVRTYLKAVATIKNPPENLIVSTGFAVIRPGSELVPEFLGYFCKSEFFVSKVVAVSTGVSYPATNATDIMDLPMMYPPLDEQLAIIQFLDEQTSRLDALLARQKCILRLLAEKRMALITQAVTQGLDAAAPRQPSGISWLGEIPAHWEVKRLRFLAEDIEQGWSPQCHNYPAEGNEWGVLKVGCVNGSEFNPSENKLLPTDLEPRLEYQIRIGDILISRANTRELLGSAALVHKLPVKLLLCDKLYRLRIGPTIDSRFMVHYLRSSVARFQYEREATGTSGSMQNIGQDTIANLPVPVPPLREQEEIVEALESKLAQLQMVEQTGLKLIKRFQEYRAALITAAVTGQIDVRAAVTAEAA
ncbi:restriction endonuclease subunit S [Microvirga sp. STS02]|uniref:restriction endonuclease subunit S n=1 Tax=Hymenobacter negativus TaxID=2795026 RepID=UPI0018DE85E9|nr:MULTISPECIES: restriction endonuclease subunit S [Bacteria]MBH8567537.1 restriction endonuclease subunit S [Hymenobacter negativus]MBR7207269.1 restriction endonuclease subunit S [Microvirga sp. STS02]